MANRKGDQGKLRAPTKAYSVQISPEAQKSFDCCPLTIQRRIRDVFERLRTWPAVSSAKPLRSELSGSYCIRTGNYRVVFRLAGTVIEEWKIGDRKDVYLE